jgi:hypothetical protein
MIWVQEKMKKEASREMHKGKKKLKAKTNIKKCGGGVVLIWEYSKFRDDLFISKCFPGPQ